MVHRVKCDEEIFYVSSGHLRRVFSDYATGDDLDLVVLRNAVQGGRLHYPDVDAASAFGYIDIDSATERDGRLEVPATLEYFDLVLQNKSFTLGGAQLVKSLGEKVF